MISTQRALKELLTKVKKKNKEKISIEDCQDRVLADNLEAKHSQPPFSTSAMDGYAINKRDKISGAKLKVIGEAAAGKNFNGKIRAAEAVRIFTGAPLPAGANTIVIQEDVKLKESKIIINQNFDETTFIRKKGSDFLEGYVISAPIKIRPAMVSLIAAMNYNRVSVFMKPSVAVITTGNELIEPGNRIPPNKIIASNAYGIAAMLKSFGAVPKLFAITGDNVSEIQEKINEALNFDLILTIGGASVGDYDLVAKSAMSLGLKTLFHSVAMKPGKPLLAGTLNNKILIGLPGNPTSSMLSCYIMVKPVIEKMLGLKVMNTKLKIYAKLGVDLDKNGRREHFLRSILTNEGGNLVVYPLERQDSSLLTTLNNCLLYTSPSPRDGLLSRMPSSA